MRRTHAAASGPLIALCVGTALAQPGAVDCLIKPTVETAVSTRELGVIETFFVDRGDALEAGQALVRLESDLETATVELMRTRATGSLAVEQAELEVEYAERRLARIEALASTSMVSSEAQDTAQTEAARARLVLRQTRHEQSLLALELRQAETRLEQRTIRSPVDGVVVERLLSVGESVEDRPVLRIAQLDPLSVEVIVPAERIGSIRVGDTATVTPRLPSLAALAATVTVVDPVIDAASNTFGVRLEVPNPDHAVPGGVRCDVSFLRGSTNGG